MYNPYNFVPHLKFSQINIRRYFISQIRSICPIRLISTGGGGHRMLSHKAGKDIVNFKKNFQTYKPSVAKVSFKMFWVSVAITASFILSQVYFVLSR